LDGILLAGAQTGVGQHGHDGRGHGAGQFRLAHQSPPVAAGEALGGERRLGQAG
jgi:hypothetical protein